VFDDLSRLAYEAALRSLDKQEQLFNEVRARAATLVAVSALAASFLGRPALDHPHLRPVLIVALAAFATSAAAGVYVVGPKRDLTFSLSGKALYETQFESRDDSDEVFRRLAYQLDRFWDENDLVLQVLFDALRISAVSLGVEVVCLLVAVTGSLF
jgi:hypothetical protein